MLTLYERSVAPQGIEIEIRGFESRSLFSIVGNNFLEFPELISRA